MRSFGTATSTETNHKDTLKRIFCFHWQQENNIYLCKISPWRLRKKKKKIRTRNETQVTFAIFYHCGRTLKTTNDMYHFSGVK